MNAEITGTDLAEQAKKDGFIDHGVATPVSTHRGMVATIDGDGHAVVLTWLFDHRGGYALLLIDAASGKSETFPMPFEVKGDCPFASILSRHNRFYTHFDAHFVEFDPVARAFTFCSKTTPQMAMSMTEDDDGRIWSATYPNSGLVSFDPASRTLQDFGLVHEENWRQYPRGIVADDAGWIYFAIGNTSTQIICFNPKTKTAMPILPETERRHGMAEVFRDLNGRVYGRSCSKAEVPWYELYRGAAQRLEGLDNVQKKSYINGSQALFHRDFPDGSRLDVCDMIDGRLVVTNPQGDRIEQKFKYESDGAHVMGLAAAPDGSICGGTAFPMRFFRYDPEQEHWENRPALGQFNTVIRQGERIFFGGYTHGFLLEWDPAKPWEKTEKDPAGGNPRYLLEGMPTINRPHKLLAHSDGHTIIMAGTPDYGLTGGGLLFWDRKTGNGILIEHTQLLPEHSTMSLVELADGNLLGGSTTDPGTGGERKATEAELYIMDKETRQIKWHSVVLANAKGYDDMIRADDGLVYGIADAGRFFVFDPDKRALLYEESTNDTFGLIGYQQGHRKFCAAADGTIYLLFAHCIARIDQETRRLVHVADSPWLIQSGGDILNDRIYFAGSSHLYSYAIGSC